MSRRTRRLALALGVLGVTAMLLLHWLVFFWVPTEATQGIVQRIFYIHLPAALVAYLAFGIVALCSAVYLWLGEEKLDMAARSAAEGGILFTTIVLVSGPLWGRLAWNTWWTWEPRLTFTLLLWFIYLGYFLVRSSSENSQRGKRFAAVVGILGVLNIPIIHLSVVWFRSLHPGPVVLKAERPTLHPDMLTTLSVGFVAFTLVFLSLFLFRYAVAQLEYRTALALREAPADSREGAGAATRHRQGTRP